MVNRTITTGVSVFKIDDTIARAGCPFKAIERLSLSSEVHVSLIVSGAKTELKKVANYLKNSSKNITIEMVVCEPLIEENQNRPSWEHHNRLRNSILERITGREGYVLLLQSNFIISDGFLPFICDRMNIPKALVATRPIKVSRGRFGSISTMSANVNGFDVSSLNKMMLECMHPIDQENIVFFSDVNQSFVSEK